MFASIHAEGDSFAAAAAAAAAAVRFDDDRMDDGEEELEGSLSAECTSRSKVTEPQSETESKTTSILHRAGEKRKTSGRVSFKETVEIREDVFDEDTDSLTHFSKDASLSKGDFSKPIYVPIEMSEEERQIRSRLVGALPAERRIGHDFARMYGCGKSVRSCEPTEPEEDDDDIEAILNTKPVREIQAHAPSAFWFGGL